MAKVARIAGAILAETNGAWFVVGPTKRPCDWSAAGFAPPEEVDPLKQPFQALRRTSDAPPTLDAPVLTIDVEGEALAKLLARRFLIERNGSVSDRLWNVVMDPDGTGDAPRGDVDARWLGEMPDGVWRIVRDAVLRCL